MDDPYLTTKLFPLQRGYARAPIDSLMPFQNKLIRNISKGCVPSQSPLVCTTPFYAPAAERWKGPVIYYVTDLTKSYASSDERQVVALDTRLCASAVLVCPNSKRIGDYLISEAGCDPSKILVVPNATRGGNVFSTFPERPTILPEDLRSLKRPIVGVIGNLAGNMDWLLLKEAIERTPAFSWVFVGPTSMAIPHASHARARSWCVEHAYFTGPKPYGLLQAYARAFDVAVLPYLKAEPTYSGSSTRFYEHLAACRPMISTRGFAEILDKEPLVKLVDSAEELSAHLANLRDMSFQDGYESRRWESSKTATWERRAQAMVQSYASLSS